MLGDQRELFCTVTSPVPTGTPPEQKEWEMGPRETSPAPFMRSMLAGEEKKASLFRYFQEHPRVRLCAR